MMIAVVPQRADEHVVGERALEVLQPDEVVERRRARSSRSRCSRSPARPARSPAARRATSAGARNSAIVVQRRRARARRARRNARRHRGGPATRVAIRPWRHPRSCSATSCGRGLAREQLLHRVVDRLPDGRRVRLVEVELDERRLGRARRARPSCSGPSTERLGALDDRQDARRWRRPCWRRRRLTRNFAKSTASGGASLPNAKPSPPPNCSLGLRRRRRRRSGTGTSRGRRAPLLVLGVGGERRRRPLAHQVHRRACRCRSCAASPPAPSHGAAR